MGQKAQPTGLRLAITKAWLSRWHANKKNYAKFLVEDEKIRTFLTKKLKFASISKIQIERAGNRIRVKIFTARPGIVIGRKGQELDKLKESIQALTDHDVLLDIQEIKRPDIHAQLISESVALQLERRISFRRAMKKAIQTAISLGVKGIKIQVAGRLGGTDIARTEWLREGSVPLHTLRAPIDYGFAEADTLYGKIGVKCWLCVDPELQR